MHLALTGFLLSLSLCLDIGAVNTAILTAGASRGFRAGWWLGFGSCFGDLTYALLSTAGATLLLRGETAQAVLRIAGTVVLLWFAFSAGQSALQRDATVAVAASEDAARPTGEGAADAAHHRTGPGQRRRDVPGAGRDVVRGVLLALSSPSAIVWFATVGGSLIAAEHPSRVGLALVLFLGGFFVAGMAWSAFLAAVAHFIGRGDGRGVVRALHLLSALMFLGLAVHLWWPGHT